MCSTWVTLQIIANTLFTIVLDMGKRDREAHFDQVWLRVSSIYKERDIKPQLTRLRWKLVVKDPKAPFADYPSLRSVKAAEARALLKACVVLAHEHLDDSLEAQFRHGLCQAMADVYMMLEGSRYTIDDYKTFQQHATKVLVYYQWLAKEAMNKGLKRWSTNITCWSTWWRRTSTKTPRNTIAIVARISWGGRAGWHICAFLGSLSML